MCVCVCVCVCVVSDNGSVSVCVLFVPSAVRTLDASSRGHSDSHAWEPLQASDT